MGWLVFMNTSDYVGEIRSYLMISFIKSYNLILSNTLEIDKFLSNAFESGEISETEKEYLTCEFPIMPVIYVLPKVHKSLNNVLGQPIVSGMGSLTEPLSNFIDAHIWTLSICVYTTIIHFLPILFFINVTFMIFLWSLREVKQNWFPFKTLWILYMLTLNWSWI